MRCLLFAAVSAVAVLTAAGSNPAAAQGYPYCLKEETGAGRAFASSRPTSNAGRPHPAPARIVGSTRITPLRGSAKPIGKAIGRATDPTKPRRGRLPRSGGGCRKAISPKPKNI